MFLRKFIRRGLLYAVGNQPDYWVILNAAGWLDKGVLTEEDLVELQAAIDAKNAPPEEPSEQQEPSDTEELPEPETSPGDEGAAEDAA